MRAPTTLAEFVGERRKFDRAEFYFNLGVIVFYVLMFVGLAPWAFIYR